MCNVLWKIFIEIKSTWRRKFKEQTPQLTLLYCSGTVRNSHQRCNIKKAVLRNVAISTGNTFARVSFGKVAGLKACIFVKKKLQHRCFPVNIAKFLRLPISKNICDQLLLTVSMVHYYMGIKVQGLNCMVESGIWVQVTGLVFVFRSTSQPVFGNQQQIPLISHLSFYIGYFWSFYMVLGQFRSF